MMSGMMKLISLIVVVGLTVVSARLTGDRTEISPGLKPKSDNKFFGHDYPSDARNGPVYHFDHPFPAVQDHQDYDYDYVKDENGDNGEWKAQMAYDELRAKVHKEQLEMEAAASEMATAKKALDDAKAAEQKAENHADMTQVKVDEAKNRAEMAEAALDRVNDEVKGEHGSISEARNAVEDDELTLEECKKQLEKVRGDLSKLQNDEELARMREAAAEAHRKELEKTIYEEEKSLKVLKADTAKELAELEQAKAKMAQEQKDVEKYHPELKDAIAKLNSYRRDADADGGVYPEKTPPKKTPAGAFATLPTLMVFVLVISNMLMA